MGNAQILHLGFTVSEPLGHENSVARSVVGHLAPQIVSPSAGEEAQLP
jgi:hypothetical protein